MKWWMIGASVLAIGVVAGVMLPRGEGQPAGKQVDGQRTPRTVTASGTGTVQVKPDTARVTFGIKSTGTDSKALLADSEKKAKKLREALEGLKLSDLAIRTPPASVQVTFNQMADFPGGVPPRGPQGGPGIPGGPGGPGPVGPAPGGPFQPKQPEASYQIVQSFSVTLRDKNFAKLTANANQVLATALDAGANTGSAYPTSPFGQGGLGFGGGGFNMSNERQPNVEFSRDDTSEAQREALAKAVAEALANVRVAAGTAKLTVTDTVTVTDQLANPYGGFGNFTPARSEINGETEFTVTVIVTCNCEGK